MDSKISIFIPTHNRKTCLLRLLRWLEPSGLDIYIADSSHTSNKDAISSLKTTNSIHYYHKSDWNIYSKLCFVVDKITSEFVVPCADDDFILWQNLEKFYLHANESQADCIVGRELTLSLRSSKDIYIQETKRYRKDGIDNKHPSVAGLRMAMNPIVCTFYQFFRTELLQKLFRHLLEMAHLLQGSKLNEIVFRSGTFILGKTVFLDEFLGVRTDEPTLRYSEISSSMQKLKLNFWDEVSLLHKNQQVDDFILEIARLFQISEYWEISSSDAILLAKSLIWEPMLTRMKTRHEILWEPRYQLFLTSDCSHDSLNRLNDQIIYKYSLLNTTFRLPSIFNNIDDFPLKSEKVWNYLRGIISLTAQ